MIENKNTFDSDFIPKNCHHIEIISQISDISMDDEWYEIATEAHFWLEWRLRAMLQQINQLNIPINQKLKALEVGCGSGILRQSIESTTNWDVDAADLNIKALSKVKTGRGKTILYNIFDENKSLIELYDVVILYDVLEHIKSTRPFIESLMKHIKPNGYLLMYLP